jgi:hypothetical protein
MMLVILRHVSTHLLSLRQALLNLRLFTVKYYMIACLRSHQLYNNCLNKTDKKVFQEKLKSDKDKTAFSHKALVVVCLVIVYNSYIVFRVWEPIRFFCL